MLSSRSLQSSARAFVRTLVCNIKRVEEADIRFHGGRGHHGGEATRAGESHRSAISMVVIERHRRLIDGPWSQGEEGIDGSYCSLAIEKR